MYHYRLKSPIQNKYQSSRVNSQWLREWGLNLCLGFLLVIGFLYVAWQYNEAIRLGYETEQLRQQIQAADEERRQLELERQRQLAPDMIDARARRQGFILPNTSQTIAIQVK